MIICADARRIPLADETVQCVVTSPPYWGLRKYAGEQELVWGGREGCEHEWGAELTAVYEDTKKRWNHTGNGSLTHKGETSQGAFCRCGAWRGAYGLEPTIEMYVAHTVEILREIRRVLGADGVCFWNIGDSYAAGGSGFRPGSDRADGIVGAGKRNRNGTPLSPGLKPKDLCLIPQRVALAAQADGWWVRSDIIWAKPNPMPESCKDRPTDAYEHVLMLTKGARYYWDAEAVKERLVTPEHAAGNSASNIRGACRNERPEDLKRPWSTNGGRNLRNVWTFATQPYKGAHFATFPEELPRRCILAASKPGDTVLDPFAGSGTTGRVAIALGRVPVMLDLAYGAEYRELAERRTSEVQIEAFA